MHNAHDLIQLFNQQFEQSHNTILVGGGEEPLYLPADEEHARNRIIFRADYFASGLHEIAHWCIAGARRRQLVDYGYWYEPDGRDGEQQAVFESVEAKPQAIEWAFSRACGKSFQVSLDNLDGPAGQVASFEAKVEAALAEMERHGFPPRAWQFIQALAAFYDVDLDVPRPARQAG